MAQLCPTSHNITIYDISHSYSIFDFCTQKTSVQLDYGLDKWTAIEHSVCLSTSNTVDQDYTDCLRNAFTGQLRCNASVVSSATAMKELSVYQCIHRAIKSFLRHSVEEGVYPKYPLFPSEIFLGHYPPFPYLVVPSKSNSFQHFCIRCVIFLGLISLNNSSNGFCYDWQIGIKLVSDRANDDYLALSMIIITRYSIPMGNFVAR